MTMRESPAEHPSTSSYYVGDAFYQDLVDTFRDGEREEREIADPALRDACLRLLTKEARLLDRGLYREWLDLFVPECAYWVPGTVERGDPRQEIAIAFHDRRQLEDRIFRLQTGFAWSQYPASRTVRLVTNHAVFRLDDPARLLLRSNFQTVEFRAGETRRLDGWSLHILTGPADDFRIQAKQVNLIDCDQNLRNPSIVL